MLEVSGFKDYLGDDELDGIRVKIDVGQELGEGGFRNGALPVALGVEGSGDVVTVLGYYLGNRECTCVIWMNISYYFLVSVRS